MRGTDRVYVHVARTRHALSTLLPTWAQLFDRDPRATPRSGPHLLYGFHQMFTPDIRPRVLVATDRGGAIRGVLPLGLRVRRTGPIFIRHLVPLIDQHAYFTDAVVDPEYAGAVCKAFRAALITLPWDRLHIKHIRQESWLLDPALGILSGWSECTPQEGWPAPRIGLPPAELLNRRDLSDMRRRERSLQKSGEIVMQWEPDGPALTEAIREFIRLHGELKTFQSQTRTFTFGTAERDFPVWLASEIAAGRAGLFTTRRDGEMLAGLVVLRSHGATHSYRAAWAPHAAAFGLGILQSTRVIEACVALGDTVFDVGPGFEPYKLKWNPEVPMLVDVSASRSGWRPTLAAKWLRLRGRSPRA